MSFLHRRPSPPLDTFIESIWTCRGDRRPRELQRVVPWGGAQLIVNLAEDETRAYDASRQGLVCRRSPGSILCGVSTRFQIIDTDEQEYVAGVSFRPGGTVPLAAVPASELRDTIVALESLWDRRSVSRLRERLLATTCPDSMLDVLEQALLAAWRARTLHPAVSFALTELRARPAVDRIGAIADAIALSRKRFIERFKTEVGVTPKRYCRVLRFQRAVAAAHEAASVDWTAVALDCGYFDQAHMIHEFREFSGLTPTGYETGRTAFQNHVTFLQSPGD